MAFWWFLGGVWYWSIAFASLGAGIEFAEKTQLELAAVTKEKRDRWRMKFVAFIFCLISILGSLGASLMRASVVVSQSIAAKDKTEVDSIVTIAKEDYLSKKAQYDKLGENYITEKKRLEPIVDEAREKYETAVANAGKFSREAAVANEADSSEAFVLLAGFFHAENMKNFMVFILMLLSVATKIAFWNTCRPLYKTIEERVMLPVEPNLFPAEFIPHEKEAPVQVEGEARPPEPEPAHDNRISLAESEELF
jgi:hypothetical protein